MKGRKKFIHILPVLLCLLCTATVPAWANDDSQRVFDYAELLSDAEQEELNQVCLDAEDALETELYILTTNDAKGKETVDYTDDFGDEHAFGYDEPYGNYMILCIDMDNRVVWLSTSGKAETYFTEERIDSLLDDLYGYLTDGDYYNTCLSYVESSQRYLTKPPVYKDTTSKPNPYKDTTSKSNHYKDAMYYDEEQETVLDRWYYRLAISAVIGLIVVVIMSISTKTAMTANARTYSKNGIRMNNRRDDFIRRTTTSRRIESNSSGSRGGHHISSGGHHISSGGHSHGGGGRSF